MKSIKLISEAEVDGYRESFLHITDENGRKLTSGISGYYYTATAEDKNGNWYKVVWEITDYESFARYSDDCYVRNNPSVIFDENGCNVTSKVILEN